MSSYKQGIVNTDDHPILRKTQLVNIIFEEEEYYIVKPLISCFEQKILKKDLIVN
jgi:hypothetical protein